MANGGTDETRAASMGGMETEEGAAALSGSGVCDAFENISRFIRAVMIKTPSQCVIAKGSPAKLSQGS